ncbi:MAG: dTDP-4-dehydrorhamnose 3,5-epimerase [Chloroflexota bacterium]|nr:MAG: dTDP-4-dehydrorhamnose 3,5-epimerase [Chloroflexota bacterium]
MPGVRPRDMTVDWLRTIAFEQRSTSQGPTIEGVLVRPLITHLDGRGDVIELWSEGWLGDGVARTRHVYQSATDVGVIKAWHLHEAHTDQFTCTRGKLQVIVADTRENSPTFGHVNSFVLGTQRPLLIQIPPGLIHGWKALAPPEAIVVNFQTHTYDAADEYKFPWDSVLEWVWEPRNG